MNVVVTRNRVDYNSSFVKVSTLEEANSIVGTIDVLVYNNSNETRESIIENIGHLKDKVKKIIYICNEKNTDMAIKMLVLGSDGKYFDDEFFLESSIELDNLISSLDEVSELAEMGGVNVLSDFFNRYLKNGSSDFNANYLMVVKDAVNDIMADFNQKSVEMLQMSETATDVFLTTSMLLSDIKKEKESMKSLVEKMTSSINDTSIKKPRVGSNVLYYPRVQYLKERSIIRIKEIGSVKFLLSFCLGLQMYLDKIKTLKPKLIVIEPLGDIIESEYNDFTWVSSNTKGFSEFSDSIVFTNTPNRDILNRLLDDAKYDIFIVLDRTVTDKDHILNCKGNVKYAISGNNIIDKFKLDRKCCFSSIVEVTGSMFTIPLFPEYPTIKYNREMMYLNELGQYYDKLLIDIRYRGY